jgi:adenylylsulfate kinase
VKPNDQTPFAVWITGLPASGKSTVAAALEREIRGLGINVKTLESDALRRMFSLEASYDERDREYFYGSLVFIAQVLMEHGMSVIFDATANRRSYRERARRQIQRFIEVFVDCPLAVCIERDPKGIYRRAREGKAKYVPGLQAVYEPPHKADVVIRGDHDDPAQAAHRIVDVLASKGFLTLPGSPRL